MLNAALARSNLHARLLLLLLLLLLLNLLQLWLLLVVALLAGVGGVSKAQPRSAARSRASSMPAGLR
jgi:hypothetical protein